MCTLHAQGDDNSITYIARLLYDLVVYNPLPSLEDLTSGVYRLFVHFNLSLCVGAECDIPKE